MHWGRGLLVMQTLVFVRIDVLERNTVNVIVRDIESLERQLIFMPLYWILLKVLDYFYTKQKHIRGHIEEANYHVG